VWGVGVKLFALTHVCVSLECPLIWFILMKNCVDPIEYRDAVLTF